MTLCGHGELVGWLTEHECGEKANAYRRYGSNDGDRFSVIEV